MMPWAEKQFLTQIYFCIFFSSSLTSQFPPLLLVSLQTLTNPHDFPWGQPVTLGESSAQYFRAAWLFSVAERANTAMNGGEENQVESILPLTGTRDRFSAGMPLPRVCKKMLPIFCGFRDHMKNFFLGQVRFLSSQQTALPCIHLD